MAPRKSKPFTNQASDAELSLEEEIAALKAEINRLSENLTEAGRQGFDAARRAAQRGAEQLKAQAGPSIDQLRANAENLEAQLTDRVRERPLSTLAFAAGAGFLLAMMSRSRK